MNEFSPRRNRSILFALWLFLYCSFALLSPPLLDGADSVHAEVAREMIQRGDPVTLYANGIRYLEQSPFFYWSMAASMKAFGISATAARFPLAVFALLLFLITESFARNAFRSTRAGIYAAVGLMLSCGLFLLTRILIPDVIVCLWLTAAIFCFWMTEQQGSRTSPLACMGFAAACALNILTKGLIGLVLPIGIVLIFLLLTRGVRDTLRRILQLHPMLSSAVFLLIAAPWHIAVGRANPTVGTVHGWRWFYFMNRQLLRDVNLRVPPNHDNVPLLLFWGLILVWMMPWSAFLFKAIAAAPWQPLRSRTAIQHLAREQRDLLLLAIASLLPMFLLSASTRHVYHVMPSLPFFTMLVARWLDREAAESETLTVPPTLGIAGQRIGTVLLLCGTAASLICAFCLIHAKQQQDFDLAELFKPGPGGHPLPFGHFLDLGSPLHQPLLPIAVSLFAGTLIAWWERRNMRPHHANIALAAATLACLAGAHMAFRILAPALSSQPLALAIQDKVRPSNLIVINGEYEAGSTLDFYLQRDNIRIWQGHSASLPSGRSFTDAPRIFETDATMRFRWTGPERIFVWTDPTKLPALPGKVYVIAEGGGKQIVSNKLGDYE